MMNRWRSVLRITFLCLILPLAGPSNVSAITIDGCELFVGTTCTLTPKQFFVTEVNGATTGDPRIGQVFARVAISVEALAAQDFDYRYQIFDQQFAVTNFLLDLTLVNPTDILASGSIPDTDPSTIAPLTAGYNSGFFSAVFFGVEGPITPPDFGSDVLFVRSILSPDDILGYVGGSDNFDALLGITTLTGPGGQLVASSQAPTVTPEPSTLILLGSGLLGLAARLRRR